MRRLIIIAIAAFASFPAAAQEWYTYSSGTGFFVSQNGYILTNYHVINNCRDISAYGPMPLTQAKLVSMDEGHDLALLKADTTSQEARFSNERLPLKAGDPVYVIGYPGQSWKTGKMVTREANIIDIAGPRGEAEWLQFSQVITRGNSGGPLLDISGNVVGVVTAKGRMVKYDENDPMQEQIINRFDLAISLPIIRGFLEANQIPFSTADSGVYFTARRAAAESKRFIVNIRCRLDKQTETPEQN